LKKISSPSDLEAFREAILSRQDQDKQVARICCSTGCRAGGSIKILEAFSQEIAEKGLEDNIEIKKTGCRGFCENGPVMAIEPLDVFYNMVEVEDVSVITAETLVRGRPVERLLYTDPETGNKIRREKDIPFFGKQVRRVLANCGQIDPTSIEDYIMVK